MLEVSLCSQPVQCLNIVCFHLFNVSGIFVPLLGLLVVLVLQVLDGSPQLLNHQQLGIISLNKNLVESSISMIIPVYT